jgi:hypothetical protein
MTSSAAPAFAPVAPLPGRAPVLAAEPPRHAHTSVGGFCGVCGSVWPCKQATTDQTPGRYIPVARW